jgi:hypothetical protein
MEANMRDENVVRCPRKRHRIAWVEIQDDGQRIACYRAMIQDVDGVGSALTREAESSIREDGVVATSVTCGCGGVWILSLTDLVDGHPPHLAPADDRTAVVREAGISPERRRGC